MTYQQLHQEIQQGKIVPVYYLHGEETWFIDKIVAILDEEGRILTAAEQAFNREVFYGPETQVNKVIGSCRSFPVMAERRLVILKEAHRMGKSDLEKLADYVRNPVPSTVLVLIFKDRKAGLPKAAVTALQKQGVDFHSKKLYERDIQQWISSHVKTAGYEMDPGIPAILTTNLGTNIPLIENELTKMFISLQATKQKQLTQPFVYEMINVDKEFNVFELINALSQRNGYRAHMIIDRLTQNVRIHPPVLTLNNLFRFFHQVALVHRHKLKDTNSIKHQLQVNYYQAQDYAAASRNYSLGQTYRNIGYIHQADLQLKGMIPTHTDARHLLKTLVWQLLR